MAVRARRQEHGVEFVQVARGGYRDQVIPPEESSFTFDAAFFMTLARCTEAGLKSPMRTEGNEARRLLAPVAAQDLFDRCAQVVVPQPLKDAAQVLEPEFVRFQKRLLGGAWIRAVKGCAAGHGAHREDLHGVPLAIEVDVRLVPIHLTLVAPGVLLRDEDLRAGAQPEFLLALAHVAAHRRFDDPDLGRSLVMRTQMRCAVCRCLRGARRSASRMPSMNSTSGPIFGRDLGGAGRCPGTASASASRMSRR